MSEEIHPDQDRSIDYKTMQLWCVGCPYLTIKSQPRPNFGGNNLVGFDAVEPRYGNTTKTHYWCGSPQMNQKQRYSQEMSFIGVSYCPYAEQKWQTLFNVSENY